MRHTWEWIKATFPADRHASFSVKGYLIGSHADGTARQNEKVRRLKAKIDDKNLPKDIRVLDLAEVLTETQKVHKELLDVHQKAIANIDDESES